MDFAKSQDLTVDVRSVPHLMKILTDLYSNPILAVVREYSINAWDSHKAAGNGDPIEVTLPSTLNPTFVVQDYGVGLSVQDLTDVYSRYGASTKRETDDEVGMLGLGCKSALTYTNQFLIRAVKDGVLVNATIGRSQQGGGVLNIINDPTKTDEPNNVRISIPVSDVNKFNITANDFFRYWEPGSVLVNGSEPESLIGIQIDESTVITSDGHGNHDYIIMGNIGYRLNRKILSNTLSYGYRTTVRVPIGTVDPTPSREDLHYTDRTEKALQEIGNRLTESIQEYAQKEIDTAKTPGEALRTSNQWRGMLTANPNVKFHYKGEPLPKAFTINTKGFRYSPHSEIHSIGPDSTIQVGEVFPTQKYMRRYTIIINYDKKELSSHNRTKLRRWAEDNGKSNTTFLVLDSMFGSPWTDEAETYDWQEIQDHHQKFKRDNKNQRIGVKVVLPLLQSPSPNNKLQAPDRPKFGDPEEMTDKMEKLLISPACEMHPFDLSRMFPDLAIVVLAKNRWEKFERENKNVITAEQKLREEIELTNKQLPDEAFLISANFPPFDYMFASLADLSKIKDPELIKFLKLNEKALTLNRALRTDKDDKSLEGIKERQKLLKNLAMAYRKVTTLKKESSQARNSYKRGLPFNPEGRTKVTQLAQIIRDRYPLLRSLHSKTHMEDGDNHFYDYVNSLYQFKYEKDNKDKKELAHASQ